MFYFGYTQITLNHFARWISYLIVVGKFKMHFFLTHLMNLTPSSYNYGMSHPFDAINMFISWQDVKMGLLFKLFFTKRYIPFNVPKGSHKNKFAILSVEAPVWQGAKAQECGM